MSDKYLLPHSYRKFGWVLLGIMLIGGIFVVSTGYEFTWPEIKIFAVYTDEIFGKEGWFRFIDAEVGDEIVSVGIIIGALLVAFTKEKTEDEFIASIRLKSLVWATYVNHAILLLAIVFVYGMGFFSVMVFNMFTLLLFFIVKYHWSLYKWRKSLSDEE